ncbi:MAG: hypothetical protein GY856_13445 [bacterium]|nr:hypothetical protein [bacterium]
MKCRDTEYLRRRPAGRAAVSTFCLLFILTATFAVHPSGAAGAQAAAASARAPRIAPGPVLVRVTSQTTGEAVPGVVVHLGGRYAATATDGTVTLDGVPAGSYRLLVERVGFETFAETRELPPGRRDAIEVALREIAPTTVTGKVMLEDSGQLTPGARIALIPVRVDASTQGRFDFTTDWAGKFTIFEVPPGEYRAEVSMPGCLPGSFPLTVAEGMPEIAFELTRRSEPANLRVRVEDAITGTPIGGARVVLAEGWPLGVIGERPTDGQGVSVFEDLRIGRVNWIDDGNGLPVSRRSATVRVEAEGYEPALDLVALAAGAALAMRLNPTAEIAEQEPNDTPATAQPLRTGAPIRLRIDRSDDRDVFRLRLAHPAYLKIVLGPENPIDTRVTLMGADGQPVKPPRSAYGGRDNVQEFGVPAGEYFLQVEEWGNNNSSDAFLTLRVTRDTAADSLEPNDSPTTARLLRSGEEARGTILPLGNVDHYRFEMERPGTVRLTMPAHSLDRRLVIRDADGSEAATRSVYGGQAMELVASLRAGRYVLELREWGDNRESIEPYTLRMDVAEDDGLDDPPPQPGRLSAVRMQPLSAKAGATVNPLRDADRYAVAAPSAGLLHVHAIAPIDLSVRALAANGDVLAGRNAYARNALDFAWSVPGPMTVYLEVREWGDNHWSASPYTLRTWWEPCDELERLGRNDQQESSTPWLPGETLRGSITPYGDVDLYRLDVDHPGYLRLAGLAPANTTVRIYDKRRERPVAVNSYANNRFQLGTEVVPGTWFVEVGGWGNVSHVGSYDVATTLERAEPMELLPLSEDPPRILKLAEAQPFVIDHVGDRDRFTFSVAQAGTITVAIRTAVNTTVRIYDDRTGETLHERNFYAHNDAKLPLEAAGPTRYRIELSNWGNVRSPEPGYVLADPEGRDVRSETLEAIADPYDPTLVTFSRRIRHTRFDVDADGTIEIDQPAATWRYPAEGIYTATARLEGDNGTHTVARLWVEATGPRERRGIHLLVDYPAEGQIIERDLPCRVRAISYTGARIARMTAAIDGRRVATAYSPPFAPEVPWTTLGPGEHVLSVTATDLRGEQATVERRVGLSDYFDLQPADGSVLSGEQVWVSWKAPVPGEARVRYRVRGEETWQEAVGESGRVRRVLLAALEPGIAYEFQPLGGGEPGPVRAVTRVKGLAFGRPRYAATIARDYDQRLGISVRNHAEEPMLVRLAAGKPEESRLLVGFVGEGSQGVPFDLDPGEEREFLLVLTAHDVIKPTHVFPVRITSESGYSDEAEVAVEVTLPEVKLEWEELGATQYGFGRRFRLHNRGDPLTDLEIRSDRPKLRLSPAVEHGMLRAGGALEISAYPELADGFTGIEAELTARSVGKSFSQPVTIVLEQGQELFQVPLQPALGDGEDPNPERRLLHRAHALVGAQLDAAEVDWSRRQNPEDSDGDGSVDRWSIEDDERGILWIANDTDGDGEIDFVHADVGADGQFDYSALRTEEGWQETSLVEAWLEMGFKLPWARHRYERHDVDVALNGRVVGRLRDIVPEGNYAFRLPPAALALGADGPPGTNTVAIHSQHLRGGHYVVSSDFRIKLRLVGMRVWTVAASHAEAVEQANKLEGISLAGPDYSVSSAELEVAGGELREGAEVALSVPLRNLGAGRSWMVPVALMREEPGAGAVEVARQLVEDVPLSGTTAVRFSWTAVAGTHTLKVLVDPDAETTDGHRGNNEAMVSVTVAGDETPPTLDLPELTDGVRWTEPVFRLRAGARDEVGISEVEVRVDGGLWQPLAAAGDGVYAISGRLPPGSHEVTVRASDLSGNRSEQSVRVTVEGESLAGGRVEWDAPSAATTLPAAAVGAEDEQPQEPPIPARPASAGAMVAVERVKSDWYCTNRPHIDVGFELPSWVMEMEIPEPGSAEYDELIRQLLERLRQQGIDTAPFERYYAALLRRMRELEQPQNLPEGVLGFLQWMGISAGMLDPPTGDPEALAAWRRKLLEKTQIFWARLLATEDPALIAEGLKRRMHATQQFDAATADSAQAIVEVIQAHQKLSQDFLETVPVVGDVLDAYAAGTGETLSGEKLTMAGRLIRALAVLGPLALDRLLKRFGGQADEVLDGLDDLADELALNPTARQKLAKEFGIAPDDLLDFRKKLDKLPPAQRGKAFEAYVVKREGADNLNDIVKKNIPVVDMLSGGKFVSIAHSSRDSYLRKKFSDLFEVGSQKHNRMLKLLTDSDKFGPVTAASFLERAELVVPSQAQADMLREWIGKNLKDHGPDWLGDDVYDLFKQLGWQDADIAKRLQDMVRAPRAG